ncbi:hypothetical protein CC1G_05977 [Coprinopsis cinerea okayama7|uniref:Uncharacterized protein n=1 Tax=Coprinopsis cinerea (strain Okayama-7 / 130 / ATCC MYA-4618 / FGSC 9003) TaxID=240176 RepID=A8N4J9_COPC7|nr:hypothetical protein CC1G_05977 [Coprinopsis cinerea okayama7\|eukprot:XP_001829768.1 hypothetical protein CC1G_05977 [Coprinopsis cinerea okayama7\
MTLTSSELELIEREIVHLENRLHLLKARRRSLLRTAKPIPRQPTSTPIDHLPDDILREIFELCLPDQRQPTLDNLEAPLLFTRVCRRWRFTACNTSRLWAQLYIVPPVIQAKTSRALPSGEQSHTKIRFQRIAKSFVKAVEDWTSRIGGRPLCFTLSQKDHQFQEEDDLVQSLIQVLLQSSRSWKRVEISIPLRSAEALIKRPSSHFPMLDSLVLCCTSRSRLDPLGKPFSLFAPPAPQNQQQLMCWKNAPIIHSPNLRSLRLVRVDEPVLEVATNWSALRSLVIEQQGNLGGLMSSEQSITIDVPTAIVLLRRCEQLEHLRLSLTPGARPASSDNESLSSPLCLPQLKSLTFHEDRCPSRSFFELLEAPALRSLEFHTLRRPNPTGEPYSVTPFIRKYGNQLEEFTFDTRFISKDVFTLFEHLAGLKHLSLCPSDFVSITYAGEEQSHYTFTDDDLLSFASSTARLCPRLESFECSTLSKLSHTAILRFIETRQPLGLRNVAATCITTREDRASLTNLLKEFTRQGMQLDIAWEYKAKFVPSWQEEKGQHAGRRWTECF